MFKILLILFTTSLSIIANTINSKWINEIIVIDGDNSECKGSEVLIAPGTFVGIMNNNEKLYFSLRTNNKELARKISLFGLTTWVNSDDKKRKETGIVYPIKQADPRKAKTEFLKNSSNCDIIANVSNRIGINFNVEGIKYMPLAFIKEKKLECAIGCHNSLFTLELAIPLSNYDKEILPFNLESKNESIRISLETGVVKFESSHNYKKQVITESRKGKGGSRPSGKGGGGRNRATSNFLNENVKTEMLKPYSIWIKVVLAKNG